MDFLSARYAARMTTQEVADYLGISIRTVKRYEKTGKAPKSVIECLLMIGGYCPTFSRRNDFTGWRFGSGFLWSPEGDKFTSGDVRAGRHAMLQLDTEFNIRVRERQRIEAQASSNVLFFPLNPRKITEGSPS